MSRNNGFGGPLLLLLGAVLLFSRKGAAAEVFNPLPETLPPLPANLFTQVSNGVAQPYQYMFSKFLYDTIQAGYTPTITSSYRSIAQQQHEWDSNPDCDDDHCGVARPGYSFHNYGLALDLNFKGNGYHLLKPDSKQEWLSSGIPQIATANGLRWGGYFSKYDPVHFDAGNFEDINQLHDLYFS